jgi:hypothetical protein
MNNSTAAAASTHFWATKFHREYAITNKAHITNRY